MKNIKSPYFIRPKPRQNLPPLAPRAPSFDGPVNDLVKMVQELTLLKSDLVDSLDKNNETAALIEERMSKVDDLIEYIMEIKKGEQGVPGDAAEPVDFEAVVQELAQRIPKPKDGKDADENKIIAAVLEKIPKPQEIDVEALKEEIQRSIEIPKPIPGKDATPLDPMDIVSLMLALPKGQGFSVKHIDGLDEALASYRNQLARPYLHGGGDTLAVGTGYTLQRNPNGTTSLVLSGSGGSFNTETPAGDIDGSNRVFVATHIPKAIILNGIWYFENAGYTLSGMTITIDVDYTPAVDSILRSVY